MKSSLALVAMILWTTTLTAQELPWRTNQPYTLEQLDGNDWNQMTLDQRLWLLRGYLLGYHAWANNLSSNPELLVVIYEGLVEVMFFSTYELYNFTNDYYLWSFNQNKPLFYGIFDAIPKQLPKEDPSEQ